MANPGFQAKQDSGAQKGSSPYTEPQGAPVAFFGNRLGVGSGLDMRAVTCACACLCVAPRQMATSAKWVVRLGR